MSRIRLTWNNASTTIVEQRVYRSISPLDVDDMPDPLAVLPRRSREYLDSTIEDGLVYYYAVSSVLPDYSELFSDEIKVEATPVESDPHWDNVVALLHFDGDLTDETGREWSVLRRGPATFETESPIMGDASYISGSTVIESMIGDAQLGGEDFTIDVSFTLTAYQAGSSVSGIVSVRDNTSNISWSISTMPDKRLRFSFSGTGTSSGWTTLYSLSELSLLTPYKVSVCRFGGTLMLFLDGVKQAQASIGSLEAYSGSNYILCGSLDRNGSTSTTDGHKGLIDELRITKGVARYTENFTPPDKPFPNN